MKTKEKKQKQLVQISKSDLLSLVASKLKDRVLFPEKLEEARKYLQKLKTSQ